MNHVGAASPAPAPAPWRTSLLAAALAAAWSIWAALAQHGCRYDDALITARYARNLLAGHGWTYNPLVAEAVNASTSPLGTLAHAGAAWLTGGDFGRAQVLVAAAAMAVAALAASRLVAACGAAASLLVGVSVVTAPLLWATLGLESTLFVATTLTACACYRAGRRDACGLALGLTILVRPDGALLAAMLGAHALVGDTRRSGAKSAMVRAARMAGLCALVALPWLVFSLSAFGTVLPHTLAAKLAQGQSGWWGSGDKLFLRGLKHSLALFDAGGLGLGYKAILALGAAGCAVALARVRGLLAPIGFGLAHAGAYTLLGVPFYPWYGVPLHLAIALALAAPAVALWPVPRGPVPCWLGSRWLGGREQLRRGLAVLWCGAAFALTLPRPAPVESHYPHYEAAACWLREHAPADASVACAEVGVLGFGIGDRTVVDMCGLVTPDGLTAIAAGKFDWWLDAHRPDFVVSHEPAWPGFEATALARDDYRRDYQRAVTLPRPDGRTLHIDRRR